MAVAARRSSSLDISIGICLTDETSTGVRFFALLLGGDKLTFEVSISLLEGEKLLFEVRDLGECGASASPIICVGPIGS